MTNEVEASRTKHKYAEERVHATQERLQHLLSFSQTMIYTCKPSGDYAVTFISENINSQLGYEAHDFIGNSSFWAGRIHPEDKPLVFAGLSDIFEKGHHTHEYRFLHKDGTYRWMHDELNLIRDPEGNPVEIVGFWMDITDRKKMEEALRESEDEYRTIFETTGTATAIIDEDTTILLANAELQRISGYSKEDIEGKKSWAEFVRQEDLERMKEYHRLRRIDPKTAPSKYEARFMDKQGHYRNILIMVEMIPGTKKSVASLLDITELRQAEEALRKSKEMMENITQGIKEGILLLSKDLKILWANQSFLDESGYPKDEVLGNYCYKITHDRETCCGPPNDQCPIKEFQKTGKPITLSHMHLDKLGNEKFVEITAYPVKDEEGEAFQFVYLCKDVTEHKQAEQTLRESAERLRFLSSRLLAAQEAERKRISMELHDELGQALVALKLGLSSIQRKLRKDQKTLQDECEYIQESIEQIIENVRRLSRDLCPYVLEHLGLSASLQWLVDDFAKQHNIKASVHTEDIGNLFSQKTQLIIYRIFQEALTNIRKHAWANCISVVVSKRDDSFSFFIEDDGKGFDVKREMAKYLPEKGLGLMAMEEHAQMLGVPLDIWSEVGKGTRIGFTIPVNKGGI